MKDLGSSVVGVECLPAKGQPHILRGFNFHALPPKKFLSQPWRSLLDKRTKVTINAILHTAVGSEHPK